MGHLRSNHPCQPSFCGQVLACTESATSEYSTMFQCLVALLGPAMESEVDPRRPCMHSWCNWSACFVCCFVLLTEGEEDGRAASGGALDVIGVLAVCCFVLLTRGWGRWARGKRRGFSPRAAARRRSRTRVPQILSFCGRWYLSGPIFPLLFSRFWNQTSPCYEIW